MNLKSISTSRCCSFNFLLITVLFVLNVYLTSSSESNKNEVIKEQAKQSARNLFYSKHIDTPHRRNSNGTHHRRRHHHNLNNSKPFRHRGESKHGRKYKRRHKNIDSQLNSNEMTSQVNMKINDQPIHINITAKVGESIILPCALNSSYGINPGVIWMQSKLGNVLTLNTNRITIDTRFEISQEQQNELSALNPNLANPVLKRDNSQIQNEFSFYHLKISNVQLYDENEYACETSMTKHDEDQPTLHSFVHLYVTQSPSFIESQTSQSNLAALENGDAVLKCFAVGKPEPRIRWYKINTDNGEMEDLNHESNTLTIRNLSRSDNSKYECVANNGIMPSVSKKFTLTVYFSPNVVAVKESVHQNEGKKVALGCVVNSNPESVITWYKIVPKNATTIAYETYDTNSNDESIVEITRIDPKQAKFQIHKVKHINQTVSYLKIQNIEYSDYSSYECQATNIVGKSHAKITLSNLESYHINMKHQNGLDSDDELNSDSNDFHNKNKFNLIYSKKQNRTSFKYQINKSEKYTENDLELSSDYVSSNSFSIRLGFFEAFMHISIVVYLLVK